MFLVPANTWTNSVSGLVILIGFEAFRAGAAETKIFW
jgi:hypothetical protein